MGYINRSGGGGGGGAGVTDHGALTGLTDDDHNIYVLADGSRPFTLGSDANGDIYYRNAGAFVRLGVGSDTEVLTLASGVPSWAAPASPAHDLGGASHNKYTLANLNTKVSDATLDDSSATRPVDIDGTTETTDHQESEKDFFLVYDDSAGANRKLQFDNFEASQTHIRVRKGSAGTIAKGLPIYIDGYNASGWVEVEASDASNAATLPAVGLAEAELTNAANGYAALSGNLTGLVTNGYAVGDELYVANGGGLTDTKPTGTDAIQKVCVVTRSHLTLGVVTVFGAGRVNDLPNLPQHNFWKGNASGVATAMVNNFAAAAAPDADNDVDEGYEPGSTWLDLTNDKIYQCVDATDGAAVWKETSVAGGSVSIGDAIGSGTAGSVLFVDASNQLGQANASLFYDITNSALQVGAGALATPSLSFKADPDTGFFNSSANVLDVTTGGSSSSHLQFATVSNATTMYPTLDNGGSLGKSDKVFLNGYIRHMRSGPDTCQFWNDLAATSNSTRFLFSNTTEFRPSTSLSPIFCEMVSSIDANSNHTGTVTMLKVRAYMDSVGAATTKFNLLELTADEDNFVGAAEDSNAILAYDSDSSTDYFELRRNGQMWMKEWSPQADATPSPTLYIESAAHTSSLNAEIVAVDYNLSASVEFDGSGGAIATQRAFNIQAPTYAAEAAQTITAAATLYIDDAPAAGANITLTDTYALWIDAGMIRLDGDGTHIAEVPANATDPTSGGGAADGRIPISVGGSTVYIPYYS